jgi:putative membrane protein insertion efficiency factor
MVASLPTAFYFPAFLMTRVLVFLIRAYQWTVSPLLQALCGPGCGCRYEPSCSVYFIEALRTHGSIQGVRLGVGRLLRCHPWGGCGHDPVPAPFKPFST